jgi:hypothetical protein
MWQFPLARGGTEQQPHRLIPKGPHFPASHAQLQPDRTAPAAAGGRFFSPFFPGALAAALPAPAPPAHSSEASTATGKTHSSVSATAKLKEELFLAALLERSTTTVAGSCE